MDARYVVVDVGALSSDHDRACEAFFQLLGGRVDYGEDHAALHGHTRFGETYDRALYPQWSAENPVHLVGHSVGATTAIELYQLICTDAFGIGSDHRWVRSIVSIAGPLLGTTLTHFFGLHDAAIVMWTLGHAIGASLSLWLRLQRLCPLLKGIYDFRMPQWETRSSFRDVVFPMRSRVLMSPDLAVYDILPARRLARNKQLVQMDKPYLVSVVTSSTATTPIVQLVAVAFVAGIVVSAVLVWSLLDRLDLAMAAMVMASALWMRLRKRVFLPILQWRMRRCVRQLAPPYPGFDNEEWEANDGAVNLCSMYSTRGWTKEMNVSDDQDDSDSDSLSSTASSSSSSSLAPSRDRVADALGLLDVESVGADSRPSQRKTRRLVRGQWFVHQVQGDHKIGTSFDAQSPAVFRFMLDVLASDAER